MTATLTRVAGTFTVTPFRDGSSWWDVQFRSPHGLAVAELQETSGYRVDVWDDRYNDDAARAAELEPVEHTIWGVKVVDGDRRRGLGGALMENLVARADRERVNLRLMCEPARSGEWIVGFYERYGFTVTRIGSDRTVYVMERPAT